MKRKVAFGGRSEREFSQSMSVNRAKRYALRHSETAQTCGEVLCCFFGTPPEFALADADARGKLRIFQGQKETHGTVLKEMPTLPNTRFARKTSFYYKSALATSEI